MTAAASYGWYLPEPGVFGQLTEAGILTYNAMLLDAAAEKAAFVFTVPKSGTVSRVGFRTGTVTTADTLKVSFQDVDTTTGDPDGAVDQFRTVASGSVTSNTWIRTGLITSDGTDTGTQRSVTRGQRLAIVIEFDAFVAGSLNIAMKPTNAENMQLVNYLDHFTAAWAKQNNRVAVMALEYSDGTFAYMPNVCPADTQVSGAINTGTTPDEVALKFRLPFPVTVGGWWATIDLDGDGDVILYDSDGVTPLATDSIDSNVRVLGSPALGSNLFATPVSLLANTFYYLALKPTTGTSLTQYAITAASTPGAALLDLMAGGQDFHWAQRTDAGAWAPTTTKRPVIGLIVEGFDDGQGSGAIVQSLFNNGIN